MNLVVVDEWGNYFFYLETDIFLPKKKKKIFSEILTFKDQNFHTFPNQ